MSEKGDGDIGVDMTQAGRTMSFVPVDMSARQKIYTSAQLPHTVDNTHYYHDFCNTGG